MTSHLDRHTAPARRIQEPPFRLNFLRSFGARGVRYVLMLVGVIAFSAPRLAAQEAEKPAPKPKKEEKEKDGKVYLLKSEKFFDEWKYFTADENIKREQNWELITEMEGGKEFKILKCTGKPFGYLRSKEKFENCEIGLEWRYPKAENGNSGILVFIDGKDQIWPTSIQVQLHQPHAGRVFAMQGAKCEPAELPGRMPAKPANEWNTCKITCRDGTISLMMNGQNLGEVKSCMPAKGYIALQSEGAEVHFRRIWKRPLKKEKEKQTEK